MEGLEGLRALLILLIGSSFFFFIMSIFIIFIFIVTIVVYVINPIGLWKLFEKGGEDGWKAIIPCYNIWTFVKMVGLKWYWFLIILISMITGIIGIEMLNYIGWLVGIGWLINIFGNICLYYNLSKKCHKDTTWFVLTIFFNWITIPVLGFSKNDVFDNSVVTSPNGIFGGNNNKNQNNYQNNVNR